MDRVLGDDGCDGLGNVLGDPGPRLIGPSQRSLALRAEFEAMIGVVVDDLGRRPSRAGMSDLATGTFVSSIDLGLEIRWDHRRGSRRSDDGCRRGLRIGHFLSQGQESEDDGFLALTKDFPCLLLGERRSQGNGSGKGLFRHHLGSKG
jgi:hypothetical protein